MATTEQVRTRLGEGLVIPACPLALDARRRLDDRRQRALFRYYLAAGAGGLAVGVHTTQFAIRHAEHALLKPVLELAAQTIMSCDAATGQQTVRLRRTASGERRKLEGGSPGRRKQESPGLTARALSIHATLPGRRPSAGLWTRARTCLRS